MVDFIKHGQFTVDWKIPFGDRDSDVVIVPLLKTKNGQNLPKPMLLDEYYNNDNQNVHIIRYIHKSPSKVIMDQDAHIFKTDTDLQAEVNAAVEWWKINLPEKNEENFSNQYVNCSEAYNEEVGRVILRASKSFIPGSSGSPIVYISKLSDRPVVGIIYQRGYPAFYYNLKRNNSDKIGLHQNVTVDSKCFFESGTTMKKVAELLGKYELLDLKNNVFSKMSVVYNLVPRTEGYMIFLLLYDCRNCVYRV